MSFPESDAHGRKHRSVEIGVDTPPVTDEDLSLYEPWHDPDFDSKTAKIALGATAVGLLGLVSAVAYRRLQQRNKES